MVHPNPGLKALLHIFMFSLLSSVHLLKIDLQKRAIKMCSADVLE